MEHLARKYSAAQQRHDTLKQAYDELFDSFARDNADLIAQLEDAKVELKNVDSDLRKAIVVDFETTGERPSQPYAGLQLRKAVEYNLTPLLVWVLNKQPEMAESIFKVDERSLTKTLATAADVPSMASLLNGIPARLTTNPVAVVHKDKLPAPDASELDDSNPDTVSTDSTTGEV